VFVDYVLHSAAIFFADFLSNCDNVLNDIMTTTMVMMMTQSRLIDTQVKSEQQHHHHHHHHGTGGDGGTTASAGVHGLAAEMGQWRDVTLNTAAANAAPHQHSPAPHMQLKSATAHVRTEIILICTNNKCLQNS